MKVVQILTVVAAALILGALAAGCPAAPTDVEQTWDTVPANVSVPAELKDGEQLFNGNCRRCHGQRGSGAADGPPLVHITYEPSHHGDDAFLLAPKAGARAHHWNYGDMPKIPTVTDDDVTKITGYIRFLQREVGID